MRKGLVITAAAAIATGFWGWNAFAGSSMAGHNMSAMHPTAATGPAASAPASQPATQKSVVYTCSMHPEVTSDKPGKCPICGMNLVKKEDPPKTNAAH